VAAFPLTTLLTVVITLHAVVLMVGGKYTYAEMPLFNWLRDEFHSSRNHYDRVGHFMQGLRRHWLPVSCCCALTTASRGGWPWWWCSAASVSARCMS
jgi:putative membrane protein